MKKGDPQEGLALERGSAVVRLASTASPNVHSPLSVTVDARIVRGSFSGAHAQTLEVIEALERLPDVDVRAVLDPAIGPDALALLDRLPAVEQLTANESGVERGARVDDLVHRPYQVTSPEDLALLARLGERIVITQLDLIAFHHPDYFESRESWQAHRRLTRRALGIADGVVFLSDYVTAEAAREGLVQPERASVVPMAVGREVAGPGAKRPDGVPGEPFLLCIGNDFRHKNRLFAVQLLEQLRQRGWDGALLLCGAHVGHGSSRDEEAAYLSSRPELAAAISHLPPVDESEKAWLYANATAVVYPSLEEGFGLVPFEAARAGVPCLFAPQASLAELLPDEAAALVPWDAPASAERSLPLLSEGEARRRHVESVLAAARRIGDLDSVGRSLREVYDRAVRMPPPDARRGLVALAGRRRLRPLSGLIVGLYRLAARSRRRSGRSEGGRGGA